MASISKVVVFRCFVYKPMGATSTGATPTGPTLDPLNILIDNFSIA